MRLGRKREEPAPSRTLLTPGPCQTSETVRMAGAREDLNHRDPEFLEIIDRIRSGLEALTLGFRPYLIGGSGTAAMEAMVTSLTVRGSVLVLADGYYAERMVEILGVHKIPHEVLRFDWLTGWDLDRVERQLAQGSYEAVIATHHETTVGRKNPVDKLAALTKPRGVKLWVDAMSSLGADYLPLDGIDAIVASANKCLHGLPGVSFVLTREKVLPLEGGARTYYLDLTRYEGEVPPLTAPVPTMAAFDQALQEFASQGGQAGRNSAYLKKAWALRTGLARLGYLMPIREEESSVTLVMASIPKPFDFSLWFDWNYQNGFMIYGCKGELREKYFQVSTMGETSVEDMSRWLATLESLG